MPIDIEKERALANAASPGPWTVDPREHRANGEQKYFPSLRLVPRKRRFPHAGTLTINTSLRQQWDEINATADFMARSRTLVPEALDEIEKLRSALREACILAQGAYADQATRKMPPVHPGVANILKRFGMSL